MPVKKPPYTKGHTYFVGVSRDGCIKSNELFSSCSDAISEYFEISGEEPPYVLELQVTKVGVPLHKIDWDLS